MTIGSFPAVALRVNVISALMDGDPLKFEITVLIFKSAEKVIFYQQLILEERNIRLHVVTAVIGPEPSMRQGGSNVVAVVATISVGSVVADSVRAVDAGAAGTVRSTSDVAGTGTVNDYDKENY